LHNHFSSGPTTSAKRLAAAAIPGSIAGHVPIAISPGSVAISPVTVAISPVTIAISPGTVAISPVTIAISPVTVAISPVIVPAKSPVAVMAPTSMMIINSVIIPIATGASPVPIVIIGVPAWSTSIHTTFAGVVTVHKLSAFLFPLGVATASVLCVSLVRSAHEHQNCQPSNQEKVPESYELHKLTLRCLT